MARASAEVTACSLGLGIFASFAALFAISNAGSYPVNSTVCIAFILIVSSTIIVQSVSGLLRAASKFIWLSAVLISVPATYVLLLVSFVEIGATSSSDFLLCNALASTLAMSLALLGLFRGQDHRFLLKRDAATSPAEKKLISYLGRSYVGSIVSVDTLQLDALVLGVVAGPVALGVYSVSLAVASLVKFQSTAANLVLLPLLARADSRHLDGRRAVKMVRAVAVVTALPLAPAGAWLIPVVYGTDFRPSILLMFLVLLSATLSVSRNVAADQLKAMDRPGAVSVIEIFALAITFPTFFIVASQGLDFLALASAVLQAVHLFVLAALRTTIEKRSDAKL